MSSGNLRFSRLASLPWIGLVVVLVVSCQRPEPVSGVVVWGHEVRELRLCGDEQSLWVIDESGELWQRYRQLTTDQPPYSQVHARLIGELEPPPEVGFGADYAGAFRVEEILELRLEGDLCGS